MKKAKKVVGNVARSLDAGQNFGASIETSNERIFAVTRQNNYERVSVYERHPHGVV